jgi:enamine deaminase RidA (YjgF/YER057c/UK114 family)
MPVIERVMLDSQPEPVSHYCHVTKAGNLVWVSGTVGIGSDGSIPDDVVEQFELAIANMDACLKAVGAGAEHVVKVTVLLDQRRRSAKDQSHQAAIFWPAPACLDIGRGLRSGPAGAAGGDRSTGRSAIARAAVRSPECRASLKTLSA